MKRHDSPKYDLGRGEARVREKFLRLEEIHRSVWPRWCREDINTIGALFSELNELREQKAMRMLRLVDSLPGIEREVAILRFGLDSAPYSLKECAELLGTTKQAIEQAERRVVFRVMYGKVSG